MNRLKSLLLFLAMLAAWPAAAESIVETLTLDDLESAGIFTEKTAVPGGTVILSNDAGELRLAYDDDWGSTLGYGTYSYQSMTVGDSGEFALSRAAVGNTNPTFVSYEQGVMTAGAVFELTAKKTGWMTVPLRMSANKQYVVFEGRTKGIPYTLGMAREDCRINFSLPATESGDIDFNAPDASKYFIPATRQATDANGIPLWIIEGGEVIASEEKPEGATPVREEIEPRQNAPQFVNVIGGVEDETFAAQSFTGFLTFRVTAGQTYYFSALGSKVGCAGFVYTSGNVQPKVTFPATDELPEVKFDSVIEGMPLAAGDDFEYNGLIYTVLDAEAKTVKTKDGSVDNDYSAGNVCRGDLLIPSTVSDGIYEYTVVELGECTFGKCTELTSVTLPNTLTKIGVLAFRECTSLPSIDIPESVQYIERGAFWDAWSLRSINIPESVVFIGSHAFAACGLSDVTIPASVTTFGEKIFEYCDSIKSVTYLASTPVPGDENIFYPIPYAVATLHMPNATLASVQSTAPWNLFKHIEASDGSIVPSLSAGDDFEYEGIWYTVLDADAKTCSTKGQVYDAEAGDYVYPNQQCTGEVVIPNVAIYEQTEYRVVEIGNRSFKGSELTSVSIPSAVTVIPTGAFDGCQSLVSVHLPDSLSIINPTVFQSCISLSSINWPSSLKSVGAGAFNYCKLPSAEFPEGFEELGKWAFQGNPIETVSLPSSLKVVEDAPFNSCNRLMEVNYAAETPVEFTETMFPQAVYDYATLNMPNATLASVRNTMPWNKFLRIAASDGSVAPAGQGEDFEYDGIIYRVLSVSERTCTTKPGGALPEGRDGNIGELDIPQTVSDGVRDYTVTAIGARSFEKAEGITSVSIPASVTIIATSAFLDCTGLTAVSLTEGLQIIDNSAFMRCTGLLSVDVPESVTTLQPMAFDGCSSLVTATLPESLTSISEMLFTNCSSLESVNIPAGVTSIENQSFLFCERLSSIQIPDGVTFIGYRAFEGCKSLSSLVLPESLTKMENSAFYGCSGLTSLTLPASLTEIEHNSFNGCSSLTSVTIPESVTAINTYAFRNCSSMKSVSLPSSLSSLGEMVFADSPIETVDYDASSPIEALDNNFDESVYADATLNTPNATLASIRAMSPWNRFGHIVASDGSYGFAADGDDFEYEGIRYTVIDNEAKTVKTREGRRNDSETTGGNNVSGDVVIPATVSYDGNDYTVVEIGRYSFWGNTEMTSVSLPETVKASETDAFEECSALSKAAFANLEALCDINFRSSSSNPLYVGHHLYIGEEEVTDVVIPESVTAVKSFTFTGGSNLASVTVHDGVTSIGSAAFDGCSGLTALELPESVASIGEVAFANCSGLTSILLPAGVTSIRNYAFSGCDNIATVTYSATEPITASENIFSSNGIVYANATLNTPNATLASVQATVPWNRFGHIVASDGSYGFVADGDDFEYEGIWYTVTDTEAKTCRTRNGSFGSLGQSLTAGNSYEGELTLPSTVVYNSEEFTVTEVGNYGFSGLSNLTSIVIPQSVRRIGMDAFYRCEGLTSVSLPYNLANIEAYAFSECRALTEISLPDSLTAISTNLFAGCSSLGRVEFPSELYSIGERAFSECRLEELPLPEGVAIIGSGAFYGCTRLSKVVIPATLRDAGNSVFGGCQNIDDVTYRVSDPITMSANTFTDLVYSVATLNMPDATLDKVRRTEPWSRFLHIVASDGSYGFVTDGDEFEYEGVWYTVIDADAKTVRTKNGSVENGENVAGNDYEGVLVIPTYVSDGNYEYEVKEIGTRGFANAKRLSSITLPETITSIPESAFHGCSGLVSASIPETVTSISVYAFYQCPALSEVQLPSGLTQLGYSAFGGCSGITSIEIPESLTVLQNQTFAGCTSLRKIDIPASITSFDYSVFGGCSEDVEVTYRAEVPVEAGEDLFDANAYTNGKLDMPNATLTDVQATAPWNKFLRITAADASSVATTGLTLGMTTAELRVGESVLIEATVLPEDATDRTVIWESDNAAVAAVDSVGNVTAIALGEATITATCGDVSATCRVTVVQTPVESISLNRTSLNLVEGESATLTATITPANSTDRTVTWTTSDPAVATVSATGEVTAVNVGEATITATTGNGLTATCLVTVSAIVIEPAEIALSRSTAELKVGETVMIEATVLPEDATDRTVTWESDNLAVAAVDSEGNVTAIALGEATITATCGDVSATCRVTVVPTPAESITLNQSTAELKVGDTVMLEATVLPEDVTDTTITWTSDDPGVATVEADGTVTAIALGEATITATCGDVSATCRVTVVPTPVESITLSQASLDLLEGETATLTATITPDDATDRGVTWTTSDASVATVSESGTVTAVRAGVATVTATAANGMTAVCSVTVYLNNGGEFEFGGLRYVVTDTEDHTVKTCDGTPEAGGNIADGNLLLPGSVTYGEQEYTVTEIGDYGFSGNPELLSVTIPATVTVVGDNAFSDCERLTSLVWLGDGRMPANTVEEIGNPNLLVYVNSTDCAPDGLDHNVVAADVCANLVLTPGYAFAPVREFTAEHSEMTKAFTQQTPIDGCAGWETITLPFEPSSIRTADGRQLVPFAALTDIATQCPFWLYEADETGEWKEASAIMPGVPYLISMPDNDDYSEQYCVHGNVTFMHDGMAEITPDVCTPYSTTWNNGREFRSLWLPLTAAEAANAMGLNSGIADLTDDEGQLLAPGSAFHADVVPMPMEAYVTRIDARRAMPVRGGQVFVGMLTADNGLSVAVDFGLIILTSDRDRTVDVVTMEGIVVRHAELKAGETYIIDNLTRGFYLVDGRKITVK